MFSASGVLKGGGVSEPGIRATERRAKGSRSGEVLAGWRSRSWLDWGILLALAALFVLLSIPTRAAEAVVLLEPTGAYEFGEWTASLQREGIRLTHSFPPAGGLVVLGDGEGPDEIWRRLPPGTLAFAGSPEGFDAERLLATDAGRFLWHAQRALLGLEGPFPPPGAPVGELPGNDALEPPQFRPEVACSSYQIYRTTSEYMLGSVSVSIILPESTGAASTEDWTPTLETNVSNAIVQGLNDLTNYYSGFGLNSSLTPSWVYHYYLGRTNANAQVAVEPISNTHPVAGTAWVNTIYDNLGYSADSTTWDKGRHFNGDVRAGDGTDWAFTLWAVNSVNDADGMFSDSWFAYAYLGGPFLVMTYDNDGWGIGQMNIVTRHESSHIFYALDEYYSSGCICTQTSGYVAYQNQNCNNSCLLNVNCIMNEVARQQAGGVCAYTSGQIGWGDGDSDGIGDPVDIEPTTSLTAYAPDPTTNTTLTFTGSAAIQAKTNQNIYHYICDMNILTIGNVQWRVNGGVWQNAAPSDGTFDGATESYTFTATVTPGVHLFETRAADSVGQTDSTPASDTVTVTVPCTDPYEPNDTCGTAAAIPCGTTLNPKICSAGDLDYFGVVPASTGTLTVVLTPPAVQDYDLQVMSAGCGTILCSPGIRGGGQETCVVSVTGGTTYVILVQGYGGAFDTANAYALTTTCQACVLPACAAGPVPADTATGVALAPTLAWGTVSGALSYDVYFGTSATPPFAGNVTSASYAPGTLSPGTQYFWSVVPKNACGTATGCATWSFTTCTPPACAAGPSPADAATNVALAPTLTWGVASGATSYDVYFGTSASPPFVGNVAVPSYAPGALNPATQHFWSVVPKNACGSAVGCATWSFTTCTLPACAAGPSPADAATGVALSPTLTWGAVSGAVSYDVYFGTSASPPFVGNVAVPSYAPGALNPATQHFWSVVPKNVCGSAVGCATWSFATCTLPACAAGPSPADATANVALAPTLTWGVASGATSYDVYFGTSASPPFATNVASPSYTPGTLTAGATYFWSVVPKNSCGPASGCAVWSFATCVIPACATGPSPAHGASGVSPGPTLAWAAAAGATSYDVYFGTSASPPFAGNVASPSYVPGVLSPSTTYHWSVVPKSACGDASGCSTWSFTTCLLPGCVSAPAPGDTAVNVALAPTLTWGGVVGATTYDVYFGTSASPPFAGNMASPSYVPGILSPSTTYHWSVVPKSACGDASGCATWSFTTCAPPACAVAPSPADSAGGVTLAPTLIWGSVADAASYDVHFGTSASPPFVGNVTSASYAPGTLSPATQYFWSVVPKSACGPASACAIWSFTTCALPACAAGPNPADAATGVPLAPTLAWGSVADATSYDVYFGTSASPPFAGNVGSPSYSPGAINSGTQYFWSVVPKNACGLATGCATWSFTTCALPPCPGSPSPADTAANVTLAPTLTWGSVGGATSYDVYFGTSASPPFAANVATPSYTPGSLSASTTYFWSAVPKNGCGAAVGCATWSFTTCAPPGCASSPSPAHGAAMVSWTPTLTWAAAAEATSYDVYFGSSASPPFIGTVASPTFSPGALVAATPYFWSVVPTNGCGPASACTVWSFTTAPAPPQVSLVKKAAPPFKIQVYGSNFQNGLRVYIDGSLWGDTSNPQLVKWKSDTQIVVKKGDALKALFPKGTYVPIRIVNPDGGETTVAFDRGSKQWTVMN